MHSEINTLFNCLEFKIRPIALTQLSRPLFQMSPSELYLAVVPSFLEILDKPLLAQKFMAKWAIGKNFWLFMPNPTNGKKRLRL